MLGLDKSSLLFPKFLFVRDGELVKEPFRANDSNPPIPGTSKAMTKRTVTPVRLYKLEWAGMEKIKAERQLKRHMEVFKVGKPDDMGLYPTSIPFAPLKSIPDSYAAKMDCLIFAIPDNYMRAINHCSMMAMQEWEHPYPFDTIIREGCYEPAAAFVKVAFHLLADCIYDSQMKYYNRDFDIKQVFEQSALVRYWVHQVGDWIAFDNAGFQLNFRSGDSRGRINNTFVSMPDSAGNTPWAVETLALDMLEFNDHLQAARPRPELPKSWTGDSPKVDMDKIMKAGRKKAKK
jgi:hypothetical protein